MSQRLLLAWMILWPVSCLGAVPSLIQHALVLEPSDGLLRVSEVFRLAGAGEAEVEIHVPDAGLTSLSARVQQATGKPETWPLRKTRDAGVFRLSHSMTGDSGMFEVEYSMPLTKVYSGRVFGSAPLWLICPREYALSGTGVRFLSEEPRSGSNVYRLLDVAPGTAFEVSIEANQKAGEPQRPQRQPERGPARILQRSPSLIALTMSLLLMAGIRLYRRAA